MPEVATKHFGTIPYQPDAVLSFPAGLPAFETEHDFVLIERQPAFPLVFLQSLNSPDLCFVALPARVVDDGYDLSATLEDLQELGLPTDKQPVIGEDVACLVLISIGSDRTASANLLAPILVNLRTRAAVQAVRCDLKYSHQYPLPIDKVAACS